jgi:hypothetical protein
LQLVTAFCILLQRTRKNYSPKSRAAKKISCRQRIEAFKGKAFMLQLKLTVSHFFPSLLDRLGLLPKFRDNPWYSPSELAWAAIVMFILKRGSRNHFNQTSCKETFLVNYLNIFGLHCPHMDSPEAYFRKLSPELLIKIKTELVKTLLEKKVFHKFRLFDQYHLVACDGVTMYSYDYEPYPGCPSRTKNGHTTWQASVLEAKLVCPNGFAISLISEFITNQDGDKKQDCERKAFYRLSNKLKKEFPLLPICILADALYPSKEFFLICKNNNWKYIVTFKEMTMLTVAATAFLDQKLFPRNRKSTYELSHQKSASRKLSFINNIHYKKHLLNWVELIEEKTNEKARKKVDTHKFVFITNFEISIKNVHQITDAGRLRWKIENEGFNEQKNRGYELSHKYSRKNFSAMQNYYQCLQIAHMITQLLTKSKHFKAFKGKDSEKALWEELIAFLLLQRFYDKEIELFVNRKCQFRF